MPTHSSLRQQPASPCSCWRRFQGIVCNILCDRDNSCWQRMGLVGCGASSTGQNSLCSALVERDKFRGGGHFFWWKNSCLVFPVRDKKVRAMLSMFNSPRNCSATLSCPSLEHLLHGMLCSQVMLEDNHHSAALAGCLCSWFFLEVPEVLQERVGCHHLCSPSISLRSRVLPEHSLALLCLFLAATWRSLEGGVSKKDVWKHNFQPFELFLSLTPPNQPWL